MKLLQLLLHAYRISLGNSAYLWYYLTSVVLSHICRISTYSWQSCYWPLKNTRTAISYVKLYERISKIVVLLCNFPPEEIDQLVVYELASFGGTVLNNKIAWKKIYAVPHCICLDCMLLNLDYIYKWCELSDT